MARSFGRVLASIWGDDDFAALTTPARLMYLFFLSQSDLDHAGLIPLRIRRWGKALRITTAEIEKMVAELDATRFTVSDDDTEELLVRSLIRRDEVYRQPNVFKSAAASAVACESPSLKSALLSEIRRLDLSASSPDIRRTQADLIAALEPFAKGSATLSEGFGDSASDTSAQSDETAGHEGSGTPLEGFPMGTSEPRGRGKGVVPLTSPSPSPLPEPLAPSPSASPRTPKSVVPAKPPRDDVERLCAHLAARIEANGSKRPVINQNWRDETRRLLDLDKRTEEQVRSAIDWCQDDPFWRGNILSMPTLREKYDQMRLQAQRDQASRGGASAPRESTGTARARAAMEAGLQVQAMIDGRNGA